MNVRDAVPVDWPAMRRLLRDADLPADDLGPNSLQGFMVMEFSDGAEPRIIGMIGLQAFGQHGLLRSLVVAERDRQRGIGTALLAALDGRARAANISQLWLLTTDAEHYFTAHGFETGDRRHAPAEIRQTPEFSSLCPDDAVLMTRRI